MEGLTIIETAVINRLTDRLELLQRTVVSLVEQNNNPYLTTNDVCKLLNKSKKWVLLHKEDLGFSKRTGTLIFKRKDIDEFINEEYFTRTKNTLSDK